MIKKELIPLLMGGLCIGMAEFVTMGILPYIAADFNVSIPKAANAITLYALGVVVGAPLLVTIGRKIDPKKLLILLMGLFLVSNIASVFAGSFNLMLISRFFSGIPHGAFFGVGAVVASRLADKGKEAQAIAVMFAGLTLANLVFVPLGTWMGHEFSWRFTYATVGILGLLTCLILYLLLPHIENTATGSIKNELVIFKSVKVWLLLLIISIGTGGLFAWISYISPLMTGVSGIKEGYMSYVMILIGFGMFVGNILGAKLSDRYNPSLVLLILLLAMAVVLVSIFLFSKILYVSLFLAFCAGTLSISVAAPIQILMIRSAKNAEMLGGSLTQAGFNIGNSLGAVLGGIPISMGFGYQSPALIGCILATFGVCLVLAFRHFEINDQ